MSTVRTLFIRSVILAYGPSFTIDGRYVEVQIANTNMFMPGYQAHVRKPEPAAFGSVLYAERNEAVKSCDNGRFWLGII